MNTKSDLDHEKVKQLLNRSISRMDQPALARLRDSRAQALARFEARHTAPAFAWAGSTAWLGSSGKQKTHFLAAAILLAAVLFSAATYWGQVSENEANDVDIAILTDDLPTHVYVD